MAFSKVSAAKAVPAWKEGGRWKVRRDDALAFDALTSMSMAGLVSSKQIITPTLTLSNQMGKIAYLQRGHGHPFVAIFVID